MKLTHFNLPKGTIFDVGNPDDRRRRFAAPRRSTNAEVKSLDAMLLFFVNLRYTFPFLPASRSVPLPGKHNMMGQ